MKNNIKNIISESWDGVISEWVEINQGNNKFTYMTKADYETALLLG